MFIQLKVIPRVYNVVATEFLANSLPIFRSQNQSIKQSNQLLEKQEMD